MTTDIRYPSDVFWLPTGAVGYYDDPDAGQGDDGWDPAVLRDGIARDGQVMPLAVGMSAHEIATSGNRGVFSFNGNHRLQVLKAIGTTHAMCENSGADDAEPLTVAGILALGGSLERPASVPEVDLQGVRWWDPGLAGAPAP